MDIDISFLWVHEVTIRPFLGTGPYGPVFGDPVTVRCLVEEGPRQVRRAVGSTDGAVVLATATVRADLATVAPPESEIDLPSGRTSTVIAALRHDGGELPVPDHAEFLVE